jgi:hypothetical protein
MTPSPLPSNWSPSCPANAGLSLIRLRRTAITPPSNSVRLDRTVADAISRLLARLTWRLSVVARRYR